MLRRQVSLRPRDRIGSRPTVLFDFLCDRDSYLLNIGQAVERFLAQSLLFRFIHPYRTDYTNMLVPLICGSAQLPDP